MHLEEKEGGQATGVLLAPRQFVVGESGRLGVVVEAGVGNAAKQPLGHHGVLASLLQDGIHRVHCIERGLLEVLLLTFLNKILDCKLTCFVKHGS